MIVNESWDKIKGLRKKRERITKKTVQVLSALASFETENAS